MFANAMGVEQSTGQQALVSYENLQEMMDWVMCHGSK
jgi:hypothetical protein